MKISKSIAGVIIDIGQDDTLEDVVREWENVQKILNGIKPRKYASMDSLDSLVEEIAGKYQLREEVVADKIEDLKNYCRAHGRRYKNYKAALENFIRGDLRTGKLKKIVVVRKLDLSLPEISDEQRQKNCKRLAEMRKQHNL